MAACRANWTRPRPYRPARSRQVSQPRTAGASSRMIRSTSGSAQASRKSCAPERSAPTGSAANPPAPDAIRSAISASTSSATAANRSALSRNWWYRAPRVTPAARTISSVPTSANPRAPNCARAAVTSRRRVASERRSCLVLVIRLPYLLPYVLSVCNSGSIISIQTVCMLLRYGCGRTHMRRTAAAAGSALFFAVAPGVVAGLVPWWLTHWQVRGPLAHWAPLRVAGLIMLILGAIVLVQAFARFVAEGHGTPAPVAPAERLVVGGLSRFVRNPMYLAVVAAITGRGLALGQPVLLGYAAAVWVTVATFVRWYEEPTLARQFGAQYQAYRRAVPAWRPRIRPWHQDQPR